MSNFALFATGAPQSSRPALGRLGLYRGWLLTPFHQVRVNEVMNGTWAPSPALGDSIQTHVYDQSIQMVPEKLIQPPYPRHPLTSKAWNSCVSPSQALLGTC